MTQKSKDIQPQAEAYIVKSHDIHIDTDYADWIAEIKHRYRSAQVKAAVKVNAEKLEKEYPDVPNHPRQRYRTIAKK